MIPLFRKVKSQAEKDALIREAREGWNRLGEHSHLIAESEEHYLSRVSDAIAIEQEPFVPPRSLTAEELAKQNAELMLSEILGARVDDKYSSIPVFAEMQKAQERRDLEKLLGPGQRSKNALQAMIDSAVEEAVSTFRKSAVAPRRESEREPLVIRKGVSSTHRTNSGGRIEVNGNECTEYGANGAYLRCWIGAPSDRPHFESLALA